MTAQELIEKLSKYPPDARLLWEDGLGEVRVENIRATITQLPDDDCGYTYVRLSE